VGDHGQNFNAEYDLNLNYHKVPLIIYEPKHIDPKVYEEPGLQQDIYPTLFGLLDFSYVNNGLGVNLFEQKREYAYFSADTKLGVIDDSNFLIYRGENNISLFANKAEPVIDIYFDNQSKADSMLHYGFSMIQSAKYLIDNKLTNITGSNRYDVDRYIAHAGGIIESQIYTNSLEALNASYQKGFRLFELDILKTSDNHYAAAHDWNQWQQMTGFNGELPPTLLEFKQHKLLNKFTPLALDDINAWFQNYSDAILVTDKVNEPTRFSNEFVDSERIMMELFTIESLKEAAGLNIKSAMPNWEVLKELKGDKIKSLVDLGITDVAASRRVIKSNILFLAQLKNRGIKVYVYHVNYDEGIDESYVLCRDMDFIYGMYADDFDFSKKIDCDNLHFFKSP
jgi:glycerophosphoryl diester phosphodiesterase